MKSRNRSTIPEDTYERIWNGKITREDALCLLRVDPRQLFLLADLIRKEVNGEIVTYVINRNINFTNICVGDCKFCAFRASPGRGYVLSKSEILQKVGEAIEMNATEVCIQGGLWDGAKIEDYCEMLEGIKSKYKIHIHAFSPMEVHYIASKDNMRIKDALKELKRSGLDSMPGTAAEILVDDVRRKICPLKINSNRWIEIIKAAHRLGIPTTSTMMYGHVESEKDRIDHLFKIRRIQRETGGFTEFIPLPFISKNTQLRGGVSWMENLKMHALSRIILYPYIKNIQASWVKLGRRLAQISLLCGVNDLGGTLMEENITKAAGGRYGEYMREEEFEGLIYGVGRIARKRTTLYTFY
jgi:FO synthase subunit 2